jgi:hypothetical protein
VAHKWGAALAVADATLPARPLLLETVPDEMAFFPGLEHGRPVASTIEINIPIEVK